jgi:hypothetical protein
MYTTSGIDAMHIKPGTEAANAQAPQLNGGKPARIGKSNHSNLKTNKMDTQQEKRSSC